MTARARIAEFTVVAGFLVGMTGLVAAWAGSSWWLTLMAAGVALMLAAAVVES